MDALFDLSSFIIQAVNFIIVALVLRKFFFVPYIKFLDEEAMKRKDLEEKLAKSDALLSEAKNDAEKILDQSRVDARMVASEIVENSRKEAREIEERAQRDADVARTKWFADVALEHKLMAEELKKKVLDIALKMNAKLFSSSDVNADFLKKNANTIEF